MVDDDLIALLDPILRETGHVREPGETYARPPLSVSCYYRRTVRLHWLPVLGRALGLVAVAREPADLPFSAEACGALWDRLSRAVNTRYPPFSRRSGMAVGLSAVVIAREPIRPEEEEILSRGLARPSRSRCVPLGLFRVNLEQEAVAWAIARGPGELYPEPLRIAEALGESLKRHVPRVDWGA